MTPLIRDGAAGVDNPGYDWKFVAPDVYDVYQAKKKLKVQLEAADAAGYKDYTAYADLYNDANAKVEALEEATVNLKSEILDFKYNSATELQPMDVTDLISQPSFKESTDGWVTKREGTYREFCSVKQATRWWPVTERNARPSLNIGFLQVPETNPIGPSFRI